MPGIGLRGRSSSLKKGREMNLIGKRTIPGAWHHCEWFQRHSNFIRSHFQFCDGPRGFVRRGITLVELLVAIAILGVVAALSLMAVANSRHSARNLECKNNLRQISLATENFLTAKGTYPYYRGNLPKRGFLGLWSYLELPELHAADQNGNGQVEPIAPGLFRCPLDTLHRNSSFVNYLPCGGRTAEAYFPQRIGFGANEVKSPAQIRDGLSNTVFYSERLTIPEAWPATLREAMLRSYVKVTEFISSEEEFDRLCLANYRTNDVNYVSGPVPLSSVSWQATFGTKYRPNTPSCDFSAPGLTPPDMHFFEVRSLAASSLHHSFVNVAMGDGAVLSVHEDIDPAVWMSAGTIAGQDGTATFR